MKNKVPKPYVSVLGRPLLVHTLKNLLGAYSFEEVVVLAHKNDVKKTRALLDRYGLRSVRVAPGGSSRADSVRLGLRALRKDSEWILVHDAARPLVSRAVVLRTLKAARTSGAALCALPVTATVKRVDPARAVVKGTEDRRVLCLAQTPQVFRKSLLLSRYRILGVRALSATDEAALFDRGAVRVRVAEGEARNIKVTLPEDLRLMEFYLKK